MRYIFHTSELKNTATFLDKYFGIGLGYFENEISELKSYSLTNNKVGEVPALIALEADDEVFFPTKIDNDKLMNIFSQIEGEDKNDDTIKDVLILIAYLLVDRDLNKEFGEMNEYIFENIQYNVVREDLLKLYIFTNSPQPKSRLAQKLTLKHSMGNVDINNVDNWFTLRFLKDYLDIYIADIESIEQAEQELLTYKKRAGRQAKDWRMPIIIYGIFRMFNENKQMSSPQPDWLCQLIIDFLLFVGIINEEEDYHIDKQYIRAQITYLKTRKEPYRFPEQSMLTCCNPDDLENSGKRLH